MPTVSPLATVRSTCCTALTMPRRVWNSTVRSRTSSSGISVMVLASEVLSPPLRVDEVAQAVAQKVEAEHREHQSGARKQRDPPFTRDDVGRAFGHHDPPFGHRRLDAEPN